MKKALLLGMMCVAAAGTYAQVAPDVLPYLYGQKISPDGKWILGEGTDASIIIYDRTTGPEDAGRYDEVYYGNGNTFALDGTCVGSTWGDEAVIFKDGEMKYVEALEEASFSTLNGITPDGSRVCGLVSNPDEKGMMYVPIYIDADEDGEYTKVKYLPHPDKDFMNDIPQYVSAVWISNDGNTILGQVVDASGMFIYPIVFKENESGEWSYTLPTASMWNPEGLEIPENPGEFDMTYPDPKSYMTAEDLERYDAAYQAYVDSGWDWNLYPEYTDFMSEEKKAEYDRALAEYQAAAKIFDEKVNKFYNVRNEIYDASVPILQNGFAMNAEGTMFAAASTMTVENDDPMAWMPFKTIYKTYIFDIVSGSVSKIESKYDDVIPNQVLSKGEIIGSNPSMSTTTLSYVYLQGAEDYVPLEEYLASTNPSANEWITNNLMCEIPVDYDYETGEEIYESILNTGHVSASDDFSVIAGAVFAYMLPDEEYAEMVYMTYVFEDLKGSGVKSIVADNSSVKALRGGVLAISNTVSNLAIYDLSGRKLFNVATAKGKVNTNLKNGIYVIAYTDKEGNKVSKKVNF